MLGLVSITLGAALAADGAEINGYVSERLQGTMPSAASLMSTADVPMLQSLTEASALGRLRLLDDRLTILVDASAFITWQGGYADREADGSDLRSVDDHDVPADPRMVFSEAYVRLQPIEHLDITVGKRRVVWGTGMAFNPSDVLNPARDPTDASLQRAGVPLVMVEAPFEGFGLSALFAPGVLEESAGIPSTLFAWPDVPPRESLASPSSDPRDEILHYAAAIKGSAFVGDTDVNVWATVLNGYGADPREASPRLSLSLSRVFFEIHELHFEGMVQAGSDRLSADPECLSGIDGADSDDHAAALGRCLFAGRSPLRRASLDDDDLRPRWIVGTRSMFDDESMLSVEWLYQADGLTQDALQDVFTLQGVVGDMSRTGTVPATALFGAEATTGQGAPTRLAVTPLRRHHAVVSWQRPHIMDDFTVTATALLALEDLSSIVSGNVSWQTTEWLTLSLWGFLPTPSLPRALAAAGMDGAESVLWPVVVDGDLYGEFDTAPFAGRLMFEARAWF